ncbi:MAG: tetratricopeptide repeat protein [Bacteroidota bacterium]|nr:tetratricopeptide repeat protein [Bacteroidota bacterium]
MKTSPRSVFGINSLKNILAILLVLTALPSLAQKSKINKDSLAARDSIREYMFRGALLSMDALQAKYESQKSAEMSVKQQKAGEAQNLFFQSRAYYRKAIAYDQNYYPAWTNMGTAYFLQDLPRPAISCYRKAIAINPDYASAWFNLGKAYVLIKMNDSAAYSYRQSIRSDSTSVQAYQELSRLIMITDDTAAALRLLRLSAYYKSSSEVPWVSMSAIYFSYNDSVNGIASLERAAKIYSGDLVRLQLLSTYFGAHGDAKKKAYYSDLLAIEIKKQEIPEDTEKR